MTILPEDLENKTGKPQKIERLPSRRRFQLRDEAGYQPDDNLVHAIRVALLLRKPLLVTGAPGTGKTDLGRYLAWKMGLNYFQYDSKSNSVSRDLYYHYDSLGRFQAGQVGRSIEARQFLRFEALGEAILRSVATKDLDPRVRELLPDGFDNPEARQSVVIIDEIDKAPRDFPNDLLNELEHNYFRIPELGISQIRAGEGYEPVVVVTSNSERNLPAPFLRRCVYYNIEFPSPGRLKDIVAKRITEVQVDSEMLKSALDLFLLLRRSTGFTKVPATAELLDWVLALSGLDADSGKSLKAQKARIVETMPALIKHEADRAVAMGVVEKWVTD